MIRIPTGLFGLIGLLLTVFLPRLPPASTSRPQRNAAPAWAMRSAYASQQSPTRRESPHAWLRNVSTQPALPRTVRQGGRPLIG